jgi:hypothetical protein
MPLSLIDTVQLLMGNSEPTVMSIAKPCNIYRTFLNYSVLKGRKKDGGEHQQPCKTNYGTIFNKAKHPSDSKTQIF